MKIFQKQTKKKQTRIIISIWAHIRCLTTFILSQDLIWDAEVLFQFQHKHGNGFKSNHRLKLSFQLPFNPLLKLFQSKWEPVAFSGTYFRNSSLQNLSQTPKTRFMASRFSIHAHSLVYAHQKHKQSNDIMKSFFRKIKMSLTAVKRVKQHSFAPCIQYSTTSRFRK